MSVALPVIEALEASPARLAALRDEIRALARERRAVILAHNYQRPEVQDVADFVGDSLSLARRAAAADAAVIVFCGVHFMAETAAILAPDKQVLLPDLRAGCSLAASLTAAQLRAWKAEFPGYVAVGYVNTTAEVKAELDYCCTSSNALAVVDAIPADRGILFCPDFFLGHYLRRMRPERRIEVWLGECHVHADISPAALAAARREHPDAEVLIHPECGCTSAVVYELAAGDLGPGGVHIASTEGMVRLAAQRPARRFIVATETGLLHRMRQAAPDKEFVPAEPRAVCAFMKTITLAGVRDALALGRYEVTVPPDIAARARGALERMIALG
jgi:quinolinate synthase